MNKRYLFFIAVISTVFYSCSPLKRLQDKEYLVNRNTVKCENKALRNDLHNLIKQKPNRKTLGLFRFRLGVYMYADKGKENKFKNWLKTAIGEEPVIYDSTLTNKTVKQMKQYLKNKGYFDATVRDSISYGHTWPRHRPKKTVNVYYKTNYGAPYVFNNLNYAAKDSNINNILMADSSNSLIKRGKNYDVDVLENERERITTLLRNAGYFRFYKNYIYYLADSSGSNKRIDIYIGVNNVTSGNGSDSAEAINHKVYHINKVSIYTDYDPGVANNIPSDTTVYNGYIFFRTSRKRVFKPGILSQSTFLKQGDIYKIENQEATYKRMGGLGTFRFSNIKFVDDTTIKSSNLLNCNILLTPVKFKSFSIEGEGTNNGGSLGISGNVNFRNKNTFKGAELLELKLKGALEAQKNLSANVEDKKQLYVFNTIEIGPELSLTFPQFLLPFQVKNLTKNTLPSTVISTGYNYQFRPDYIRSIANVGYSYSWRESTIKRHIITVYEINGVKITNDDSLQSRLRHLNDKLLLNSYKSHLITASRYTFVYNSQDLSKFKKHVFLFNGNIEVAGTSLRVFNSLTNSIRKEQGAYEILGLQYAQYVKTDIDFRYYHNISLRNSVVYRITGGVGYAYGNSTVMPFEKSYFGGGSNDIRAWSIRRMGPGSYSGNSDVDQLGDIKLEGNLEYRFDAIKLTQSLTLQGASFLDAGNIWTLKNDPTRDGSQFEAGKFYKDIALGGGLGARFNFNFFIFRFDYGIKLRDPSFTDSWVVKHIFDNNWKLNNNGYSFGILNLGIGYPF